MADRWELSTVFDDVSRNDRRKDGERFTCHRMESRVFLPRYRHSISLPFQPKPRKPLESYMYRLSLRCNLCSRQIFTKIHDPSEIYIQSKYKNSIKYRNLKEEFSKESVLTGFANNYWLSQIKQAKNGLVYLSPMSFLFKTVRWNSNDVQFSRLYSIYVRRCHDFRKNGAPLYVVFHDRISTRQIRNELQRLEVLHLRNYGVPEVIMSKTHSPTHFNGDIDNFYDSNFPVDMNTRMQVPKSIRVNGDYPDEDIAITNRTVWNQIPIMEKFEMHVPERILVVGQEQHVGTKAPPPEIVLENAVMRTEPAIVRVQTPPRSLTLDNHYFPAVDEEDPPAHSNEVVKPMDVPKTYNAETQITRHVREQTPFNALDVSLPPSEEVQHLRRQVGKLNRRVMALELDMLHRQQRDKLLYIATVAYFILKAFSWITRN